MSIEINRKIYISVKGTAKSYGLKSGQQISYHLRNNPNIFESHVISQEVLLKKSIGLLTPKERATLNKLWLDKFTFIKVGTLLNNSPKTILILSSNDVHDNPSKLISNQLGNNQGKKPKSINKKINDLIKN